MVEISDDFMRSMLGVSRGYSVVLLTRGPNYRAEASKAIVWEHARRNFALRAEGKLAIVCPVMDDSPLCGVGIFTTGAEETQAIMEDDPGVKAGVFVFEVHPARSFPGDALPAV